MRVALVQHNLTVGDHAGNLRKLLAALDTARGRGAELAVTSELALSAYPPKDLLERPGFLRAQRAALDELVRRAPLPVLVGVALEDRDTRLGHGLHNAAVLVADGRIQSTHRKSLLPTYDVFDESRHFDAAAPGSLQVATLGARRIAVTICEDIWNVPNERGGLLYPHDPPKLLADQGADLLVNLSASPFTLPKRSYRPQLLASAVARTGLPLVFVNQVGGMDELLFDGHSLAMTADGRVIARCHEFAEDLVVADFAAGTGEVREHGEPVAAVLDGLVMGTRDYAAKCGFRSAVLGLSGGVDSALTACIAVRALGRENVVGVAMPSRYSSDHSVEDARVLAESLGIAFHLIPIEAAFTAFLGSLQPVFAGLAPSTAEENLQARSRGVILMALSNKFGHLLLTTGNKSELAVGYCTLYGDMAGGLAVISDVPKTMVYRLSREVNRQAGRELIPERTLTKPPSAELRPDQTDQDSLPPYDVLDAILELHVESQLDAEDIVARGFDAAVVGEVVRLVRVNEYKRQQAAPGLKVTSKAFGSGRRIPIATRWP